VIGDDEAFQMTCNLRHRAVALLGCLTLACATDAQPSRTPAAQDPKANADALVLQDFQNRIDAYMDLRKKLEKESPRLKETNDPGKIKESQDVLAGKIIAARKDAKHGDIFTPEIRQLFRRLMYPEMKGSDGKEAKHLIKEDAPTVPIPLKANAKYPEGAPVPTVPPDLLARLPKLPEDLEYRIIKRDLILRDVHANLIVDFIPKAIH
jgi:hypothetical protein